MVLLDLRGDMHRARLSRLAGAGGLVPHLRPHLHRLLFCLLSPGHAFGWPDRKAERAAGQHRRARASAKRRIAQACSGGGRLMRSALLLAASGALLLTSASVSAAEDAATPSNNHGPKIAAQHWSFAPPFGSYDNAQLQRGFQVYQTVCANCHSMRLLSYRNLGEPGGPQFSPKAVEVLASQVHVTRSEERR